MIRAEIHKEGRASLQKKKKGKKSKKKYENFGGHNATLLKSVNFILGILQNFHHFYYGKK